MKQTPIVLGVTVLTLGFFSVVPGIRAIQPPEVDASGNVIGEPAALGEGALISLPLKTIENFSFGTVTESSAEAAEADKLAKQLANPISSLISVPFQADEDFAYGPSHNGYKFTHNIQPVIPISISRDWNPHSMHNLPDRFAARSLLRRELAQEFAAAAAKPFAGWLKRHDAKLFFLA